MQQVGIKKKPENTGVIKTFMARIRCQFKHRIEQSASPANSCEELHESLFYFRAKGLERFVLHCMPATFERRHLQFQAQVSCLSMARHHKVGVASTPSAHQP